MDEDRIAAWLNSLTDYQFVEFFYKYLASRHLSDMERSYVDSHLVLATAKRILDDNGETWGEWSLELVCPTQHPMVDDTSICEGGQHCGLETISACKYSICPICGEEVYGT